MIKGKFSLTKIVLLGFVSVSMAFVAPASLYAASFPSRPLELIVPFAAGGGVDANARAFAPALETALSGTVLVVDKPGAGGVVGLTYAATARNDGHTLAFSALNTVTQNAVLADFKFDPREAFIPLGSIVFDPSVVAVSKSAPFNTLSELVAYVKEHPGELTFGATGIVSLDAMICHDLMSAGGIQLHMVNFDGAAETMAAIMGGHIQVMGGTFSEVWNYHQDGEVKILGVGAKVPELPDVKTFEEQGYDLTVVGAKRALFVPGGTDKAVVDQLVAAVKQAAESEDFRKRAELAGLKPTYTTPEECEREVRELMDFFAEVKVRLGL